MFYAARQFSRASSVTSQSSYYPESSDIDDYEDSSEALDDAIRFSEVPESQSVTPTPNKRRSYHEYQHHQFQVHSGSFLAPPHSMYDKYSQLANIQRVQDRRLVNKMVTHQTCF